MAETVMTRGRGCDRSLIKAERFRVATESYSVVT